MARTLEFYFDFGSPYSYLADDVLRQRPPAVRRDGADGELEVTPAVRMSMSQPISITALPTTLRSSSTRKASAACSIGKRCEMCGRMTPSAASRGSSSA